MEEYCSRVLRLAVLQLCESMGARRIDNAALSVLTDVLIDYIAVLGRRASGLAAVGCRTEVNIFDALFAIRSTGTSLKDLAVFRDYVDDIPFYAAIPPVPLPSTGTFRTALAAADSRLEEALKGVSDRPRVDAGREGDSVLGIRPDGTLSEPKNDAEDDEEEVVEDEEPPAIDSLVSLPCHVPPLPPVRSFKATPMVTHVDRSAAAMQQKKTEQVRAAESALLGLRRATTTVASSLVGGGVASTKSAVLPLCEYPLRMGSIRKPHSASSVTEKGSGLFARQQPFQGFSPQDSPLGRGMASPALIRLTTPAMDFGAAGAASAGVLKLRHPALAAQAPDLAVAAASSGASWVRRRPRKRVFSDIENPSRTLSQLFGQPNAATGLSRDVPQRLSEAVAIGGHLAKPQLENSGSTAMGPPRARVANINVSSDVAIMPEPHSARRAAFLDNGADESPGAFRPSVDTIAASTSIRGVPGAVTPMGSLRRTPGLRRSTRAIPVRIVTTAADEMSVYDQILGDVGALDSDNEDVPMTRSTRSSRARDMQVDDDRPAAPVEETPSQMPRLMVTIRPPSM